MIFRIITILIAIILFLLILYTLKILDDMIKTKENDSKMSFSVHNNIYLAGQTEALKEYYKTDKEVYDHAELNDLANMINIDILNNVKSGKYDNQLNYLIDTEHSRMTIITDIEFTEKK